MGPRLVYNGVSVLFLFGQIISHQKAAFSLDRYQAFDINRRGRKVGILVIRFLLQPFFRVLREF